MSTASLGKPLIFQTLVTFDAGDPAGIMFFPNYFVLSQRAWEHQLVAHQIPWAEWYDHPDWGVPLKHVQGDFLGMIRPGEKIAIHQSVKQLGTSSVTLKHDFFNAQNSLCASLETVHVFINKKTLSKRAIPDSIRSFLKGL